MPIFARVRARARARALMDAPVTRGTLNAGSAGPGTFHRRNAPVCGSMRVTLTDWVALNWIEGGHAAARGGARGEGCQMPAGCSIASSCCARPNRARVTHSSAPRAHPFSFFDTRVQTRTRGRPRTQLHLSNSAYVRGGRQGGPACEENSWLQPAGRCAAALPIRA